MGLAVPRQGEVVRGGCDRRREADEEVRRSLARALIHHGGRLGAYLLSILAGVAVCHGQVDHVLAVVGAGLQDLRRFNRGKDLDAGQRQACLLTGRCGQSVELTFGGFPVLDQRVDVTVQGQDAVADQQASPRFS